MKLTHLFNFLFQLFDENNRTVLHYAALYDRTECIQILLKHKANRNALDKVFACPAHYAAQNSLGALKLLTAGVNEVRQKWSYYMLYLFSGSQRQ